MHPSFCSGTDVFHPTIYITLVIILPLFETQERGYCYNYKRIYKDGMPNLYFLVNTLEEQRTSESGHGYDQLKEYNYWHSSLCWE